jgi:hypothetical protein
LSCLPMVPPVEPACAMVRRGSAGAGINPANVKAVTTKKHLTHRDMALDPFVSPYAVIRFPNRPIRSHSAISKDVGAKTARLPSIIG